MLRILLFFLSLFCFGTIILIPLGIVGLWYFSRPDKVNGFEMDQYDEDELERFI